jgi:hypothetical protein
MNRIIKDKGIVLLSFMSQMNNLLRERFILSHGFRSSGSRLLGPVALGLWQHNTSWWEHVVEETCLPHEGWEAERGKAWDPDIPFKGMSPIM